MGRIWPVPRHSRPLKEKAWVWRAAECSLTGPSVDGSLAPPPGQGTHAARREGCTPEFGAARWGCPCWSSAGRRAARRATSCRWSHAAPVSDAQIRGPWSRRPLQDGGWTGVGLKPGTCCRQPESFRGAPHPPNLERNPTLQGSPRPRDAAPLTHRGHLVRLSTGPSGFRPPLPLGSDAALGGGEVTSGRTSSRLSPGDGAVAPRGEETCPSTAWCKVGGACSGVGPSASGRALGSRGAPHRITSIFSSVRGFSRILRKRPEPD